MQNRKSLPLDGTISELEKRIDKELRIKEGAVNIRSRLSNPFHVEQASISVNDSEKRLSFLYGELEKAKSLRTSTILNPEATFIEECDEEEKINKTDLGFIFLTLAYLCSSNELTVDKIVFKIAQLQYKLSVEQQLMNGAEKMLKAVDKKLKADAEATFQHSKARLILLKASLAKYHSLNIEGMIKSFEMLSLEPSTNKKSFTVNGSLRIKIIEAVNINLASLSNSKNEGYCSVFMDNVKIASTKTKAKLVWNEEIAIQCDRSNEIEICIFDKNDLLKALLFFRLDSLVNSDLLGKEIILETDPVGELRVMFDFESLTPRRSEKSILGRRKVIKRKVHTIMGHDFSFSTFYQVLKCAVCEEFLLSASGYQCQYCNFLCHKKCHQKVVAKCLSKISSENEEQIHRIKFNIPHRTETVYLAKPNWCNHCGHLLPLGKKSVRKCIECNHFWHDNCSNVLPNFCGLTQQLIDNLLHDGSEKKIEKPTSIKKTGIVSKKYTLDDFSLISVLGRGNFGKVILAEEKKSNQIYAIKILKKEFIIENDEVESVISEKRIFSLITKDKHPFLVNLHACFQSESRIFFVMEYVNGGDLMWHIQHSLFSEFQAKLYAAEVLLVLEYFHKNNIVYRDLKLDNILLASDGHIKIADYGLCKENMGHGATTKTFCGTPEFMAPEILLDQKYGKAVDWWAFGVLVFEMLSGQAPFKGHTEDEIFASILKDQVQYPTQLSIEAISLLKKLLSKDPAVRLGSSKSDAEDVKNHPFFRDINFTLLYEKKIDAPFKPHLTHNLDTSNFDEEFTKEEPVMTPVYSILGAAEQLEFKGFSYICSTLS